MKARFLLSLFLTLPLVSVSTPAFADDTDPLGGFSGSLVYSNELGRGTFTPGEFTSRPAWNMSLSVKANYKLPVEPSLKLQLAASMSKTVVENSDSLNTQKNQTYLNDIYLTFSWSKIVDVGDGLFTMSGYTRAYFPTSLFSQLTQKYLGLKAAVNFKTKPASWVSLSHSVGATKNFNKYDSVVLDTSDFDFPVPARAGGGDAVGENLVGTGTGITEWLVSNSTQLGFTFLEDFNFTVAFAYAQYFKYKELPIDELSSKYATAGRGYTDLMEGTLELGYDLNKHVSFALGTTTLQLPKTADNKSFRFPWWDTTNGAGNYQAFYFDVAGSF